MMPRFTLNLLVLFSCTLLAQAALVFDISEEIVSPTQTNVVIHAYGSANIDGLTSAGSTFLGGFFSPQEPSIFLFGAVDLYDLPEQLPAFGLRPSVLFSIINEGSAISYDAVDGELGVPENYVSEGPLDSTMTLLDITFDDYSLVAGESYSISWAEGTADEDSLTVNIVPEPSSILLIGAASGLLALARQKRKTLSVH